MYLAMVLEGQSIDQSHLFHKEADRDKKAIELAKEHFHKEESIQFDTLQDVAEFQASMRFFDQCYDCKIITDEFFNIK